MDRECQQIDIDIHLKSGHTYTDPSRKWKEGDDVEDISGTRCEGSRVELGPAGQAGSRLATVAFIGIGLML